MNPLDAANYVTSLTDDKCDPALGKVVRSRLLALSLEKGVTTYDPQKAVEAFHKGIWDGMNALGLDVAGDPSLQKTPYRFAAMFVGELTSGLSYEFFPKATTTPNDMDCNEMVVVQDISTMSLCEHHLQTIDGVTHIGYIPGAKVLGLSKFARITEFFARRPQIQERMTAQIFAALQLILETDDIAVVQKATHYCMKARGAMQSNSKTTTSKMGGRFMSNQALREEFFNVIGR
jgi:GTP cyclohydrolase I